MLCHVTAPFPGAARAAPGDFTRNGRLYYLLDMVRKDEVGVDTQTHTETVTLASDSGGTGIISRWLLGRLRVLHAAEGGGVGHHLACPPPGPIRICPKQMCL